MSRKNKMGPWKALDAVDISVDQAGTPTDISYLDNFGISIAWSGVSPVGQILVEASADGIQYHELDFGNDIVVSGNTGEHMININQNPFAKIKVSYLATSGTGTLTAILHGKQVGG
jgi:hypothetical protein